MVEVPSSTSMWACYQHFWMLCEWSAIKCCNINKGNICSTSSHVTLTTFDLWTLEAKYNIFFKVVNFINNSWEPIHVVVKGENGLVK